MVESILHFFGTELKPMIPGLQNMDAPAKRLNNGVIYINRGQEKRQISLDDNLGPSAYVRITNPETVEELPRRTSCSQEYKISAKCRLVYFDFINKAENEDFVRSLLITKINEVSFKNYQGTSKRITLQISSASTDFERLFTEETTKVYESDQWPVIIAIDFTLSYEDKNCVTCGTE